MPLAGHRRADPKRGIAFLEREGDDRLDARLTFDRLTEKRAREVRTRFDHWIDGFRHDNYFHGWPNLPEYKECFVFKWKEQRLNHRLYGFLFHPLSRDRAFQLCVLASHAVKSRWETDPRELNAMNELRTDPHVIAAIHMVYADENEECAWTN